MGRDDEQKQGLVSAMRLERYSALCSTRHQIRQAHSAFACYRAPMERLPVVAGLLRKRAEIERVVADLEREVRRRKAEIVQLDATIRCLHPI